MSGDDDKARFASVVMPHLADAYALARWLTGDRADAEDVVQEACLRAFRAVGGFAGGNRARVGAYHRAPCRLFLARQEPPDRTGLVDDLEAVERGQALRGEPRRAVAATPETELIAKADAARLEAAIAALPAQFRETLVLRDIHGLDYREIAQVTDVPVGTVMSRLARARRRLIDAIGADDT